MLLPLLLLVAIGLGIIAIGLAVPLLRLTSVRLRPHRALAPCDEADVPADVLASLRRHGARLEALGFARAGALREEDAVAGVDAPGWSLLYRSPQGDAWARLSLADSPMRAQPVDLAFVSLVSPSAPLDPTAPPGSADASGDACAVFETVAWRLHRLASDLPEHRMADARTLDVEQHWAAHRRHVDAAAAGPIVQATPVSLVERLDALRRRALERERAQGRLVARRDGTLRYGLQGAFGLVLRANGGEGERLRALAEAPIAAQAGADADVTPDLVAHRRREAVEASRPRASRLRKALVFTGSMLLFVALFGLRFSMETVLMLVAALVFHEAGHAIAMRVFGYRDLQILFVPFLGALATGRSQGVRPWQEIVMLLAGPVPGIVLGTWLMTSGAAERDPALDAFANVLIALNYVNLLPIFPLDGGKIMNIVLFDRLPRAQLCFSALSGVGILAIAIWSGEWAIACIGVALLVALPGQRAQALLFLRLRGAAGRVGQAAIDPLRAIYAELRDRRFDRWNSETRYQFVNRMRERLARERAGLSVGALGLAAYAAVWVVPVDAMVEHHVERRDRTQAVAEQSLHDDARARDAGAPPGSTVAERRALLDEAVASR